MSSIAWIFAAYLLGSVSFAIVLSQLFNMDDPRSYGSNNPGATNMLRSGRKSIALLTLLGDALKGFLPVFLAKQFTDLPVESLVAIGLAAFMGHLYPFFYQFKGGKGVATFFGVIIALSAKVGIATMIIWLLIAWLTRYSSLASLVSSVAALIMFFAIWGWGVWVFWLVLMVGLLFWRHRVNIAKLRAGTESRLFNKT